MQTPDFAAKAPFQPLWALAMVLAKVLTLGALSWLVTACGALSPPSAYTLSQADLQQRLERRFPLERRLMEVFEVTATQPLLRLDPPRNRIAADLQLAARDRLLGGRWSGRLSFDAALRFDATDQSVRLQQVKVLQLQMDGAQGGATAGAPPGTAGGANGGFPGVNPNPGSAGTPSATAQRLAALLAERVLEGLVVFQLSPEQAEKLKRAGVAPQGVAVTPKGLEFSFAPI
jgi:hypothetical protein